MVLALLLLLAGALILYAGAELSVRSATSLARAAGVPAFFLGALLFGVDIEGTGAAVVAAGRGETEIAAGTIFGAVVFLFSAGFGAALLLSKEPVPSPSPLMVVAPSLPMAVAGLSIFDRYVDRMEGGMLLVLYAGYVFLLVRQARQETAERGKEIVRESAPGGRRALFIRVILGLALLYGGAMLLLNGGVRMLEATELAAGFVGAAVIGVLASLDEVLLEVLPIRRGDPDLATGNLFGTLAAFSTGVLGLAALVHPLDLDGAANAAFLAMALLYTLVAVTFVVRGKAGRVLGGIVLASYAAWLVAVAAV